MSSFTYAAGCAIVWLMTNPVAAAECKPAFSTSVKLVSGRPMIDVSVNNHPATALLDTGATNSSVQTDDMVANFELHKVGLSGEIVRPGAGNIRIPIYNGKVTIGGTDLQSSPFWMIAQSYLGAQTIVVGESVLKRFDVVIEQDKGQLLGFTPGSCEAKALLGPDAVQMNVSWSRGRPLMSVMINGFRVDGIMDTGSNSAVSINRRTALRLGISNIELARSPHRSVTMAGGSTVEIPEVKIKSVSIAGKDAGIQDVLVRDMYDDAMIGEDTLKHFDIAVLANQRQVYLRPSR